MSKLSRKYYLWISELFHLVLLIINRISISNWKMSQQLIARQKLLCPLTMFHVFVFFLFANYFATVTCVEGNLKKYKNEGDDSKLPLQLGFYQNDHETQIFNNEIGLNKNSKSSKNQIKQASVEQNSDVLTEQQYRLLDGLAQEQDNNQKYSPFDDKLKIAAVPNSRQMKTIDFTTSNKLIQLQEHLKQQLTQKISEIFSNSQTRKQSKKNKQIEYIKKGLNEMNREQKKTGQKSDKLGKRILSQTINGKSSYLNSMTPYAINPNPYQNYQGYPFYQGYQNPQYYQNPASSSNSLPTFQNTFFTYFNVPMPFYPMNFVPYQYPYANNFQPPLYHSPYNQQFYPTPYQNPSQNQLNIQKPISPSSQSSSTPTTPPTSPQKPAISSTPISSTPPSSLDTQKKKNISSQKEANFSNLIKQIQRPASIELKDIIKSENSSTLFQPGSQSTITTINKQNGTKITSLIQKVDVQNMKMYIKDKAIDTIFSAVASDNIDTSQKRQDQQFIQIKNIMIDTSKSKESNITNPPPSPSPSPSPILTPNTTQPNNKTSAPPASPPPLPISTQSPSTGTNISLSRASNSLTLSSTSTPTFSRTNGTNNSGVGEQKSTFKYGDYSIIYKTDDKNMNNPEIQVYRETILNINLKVINTHNQNINKSFQMGLGPFADLSNEEFAKRYAKLEVPEQFRLSSQDGTSDQQKLPSIVIDWRCRATSVISQGVCGACYVISAVEAISISLATEKQKLSLSIQEVLSCGRNANTLRGCEGGFFTGAYDYVKINGIGRSIDYEYDDLARYVGVVSDCRKDIVQNPGYAKFRIRGYQRVTPRDCVQLINVLRSRAVSVAIAAYNFQFYVNGTFTTTDKNINHGVTLVGYYPTQGFLIKNSWGVTWGKQGYGFIDQTTGVCNFAVFPVLFNQTQKQGCPQNLLYEGLRVTPSLNF